MINFTTNFWAHEAIHFVLVGLISGFFYWRYRDWRLIFVTLLLGIFLDVDHFFDFFVCYGKAASLSDLLCSRYIEISGKVYVLFHGWEFIPLLALLGLGLEKKLKIKGLMWVMILAYGTHLLWDHLCFGQHPLSYFITYRFLNHFSIESFHGF